MVAKQEAAPVPKAVLVEKIFGVPLEVIEEATVEKVVEVPVVQQAKKMVKYPCMAQSSSLMRSQWRLQDHDINRYSDAIAKGFVMMLVVALSMIPALTKPRWCP